MIQTAYCGRHKVNRVVVGVLGWKEDGKRETLAFHVKCQLVCGDQEIVVMSEGNWNETKVQIKRARAYLDRRTA